MTPRCQRAAATHQPGFDEYYGLMDGAVNFFNPTPPDPKS